MVQKSTKPYYNKLLALLNSLTLQEKRDLKVFIGLPSNKLTKKDKVTFEKLMALSQKEVNKLGENIWDQLLEDTKSQDINRIRNRLFKATERYISLVQLESNEGHNYLVKAQYYTEHNMHKVSNAMLQKSIAALDNEANFDRQIFLFWLYQMAVLQEKDIRKHDQKLHLMEYSLDEFYVCNKLRIICEKANRQKIIGVSELQQDYAFEALELSQGLDSINGLAYYNLFLLITKEEEKYFHELDQYIQQYEKQLTTAYLKEFYAHLMNYCIRQLNKGHFGYAAHYINYIEKLEDQNALLANGLIGIGRFKNAITASIVLGKTEWGQHFIDKYRTHISPTKKEDQDAFLALIQAVIELHKDNTEACLTLIKAFYNSAMYHKDFYFKITCDKLFIKAYYELGQMDPVINRIQSIRSYIRSNKKLPKSRKQKHLNFLTSIDLLAKRTAKDEDDIKDKLAYLIPDYLWLAKVLKRSSL